MGYLVRGNHGLFAVCIGRIDAYHYVVGWGKCVLLGV